MTTLAAIALWAVAAPITPIQDAEPPVQLIEGVKLRDEAGKDSGLILLLQPRLEVA